MNTLRHAKYENNASGSISSKSIPVCLDVDVVVVDVILFCTECELLVGSRSSSVELVNCNEWVDGFIYVGGHKSLTDINKANGEPIKNRFAN